MTVSRGGWIVGVLLGIACWALLGVVIWAIVKL